MPQKKLLVFKAFMQFFVSLQLKNPSLHKRMFVVYGRIDISINSLFSFLDFVFDTSFLYNICISGKNWCGFIYSDSDFISPVFFLFANAKSTCVS